MGAAHPIGACVCLCVCVCVCVCAVAVGEYISVSSQRDTEEADIQKERDMQAKGPEAQQHELEELTQIYVNR